MSQAKQDPTAWRARAAELADELRAINEALAVRSFDAEDLAAATGLARQIRRRLEGPPRSRWYDGFESAASMSAEAQAAYLDQSPIRGRLNPVAPPLVVEHAARPDGKPGIEARARLSTAYEGPPHGVHGGWVAALFDDLLGSVQGLSREPGVTATLRVHYRHVTPVDEELRLAAWIHEDRGNRLVARATCHAGDTLTAEAEGLFVRVDVGDLQERMQQRRARRD